MSEFHQLRHEEDVRTLMATEGGRRVLWWLMDDVGGLFGKSYTGSAEVSVHLEGRRAVALEVMRDLQVLAPAHFRLMVNEALVEQEAEMEADKPEAP